MTYIFLYITAGLLFVILFTREVIAPASKSSCDMRWFRLASAINLAQMIAALAAGHLFSTIFANYAIFPIQTINAPLAGAITFFTASFVAYWWHRAMHASSFLWRIFHQLHHSPSRIETLTAFYAHPIDSIGATAITCSIAYLGFGFNTEATAWSLLYVTIFNAYIHSDTSSPRWLGLLIQRPEMHRVHHQRGHHAQNYGLPLWDLLFRTWHNPTEYVAHCGFKGQKEHRIYDMLMGHDVHRS